MSPLKVLISDYDPSTGWFTTFMSTTFPILDRIGFAFAFLFKGTIEFRFSWREAGAETQLYLDDISFEITRGSYQ